VKPFSRTVKGKTQNVKGFGRKVNTTIPQRQFIGDSPQLKKEIEIIVNRNMKQFNSEIQKVIRK
jgi:phage gpG-like protein